MAEPAHNLPEEDRPVTRPDLRAIQGGGEGDGVPRGDLRSAEESGGLSGSSNDSGSAKGYNPDAIKGREQFADKGSRYNAGGDQGDKDSLYNAGGDKGGRFGGARRGLLNLRGRIAGGALKNKWLVGIMATGAGSMFVLVMLMLLLVGSLKIPNLATHIAEYQFARVLRQFVETNKKITYEKLSIDSVDDSAYARMKANYENVRKDTWGRLDKYRPNQVIKNMKGDESLKFNYDEPTITGRQRLKSVTLNGQDFKVTNQGYTRFIPGISDAIDFKNNVGFTKDFAPALVGSAQFDKLGPIVRGQVAKKVRQELGIGLIAWNVAKYAGKTEAQARLVQEREVYQKVAAKEVIPAKTPQINDAANEAKEVEQKNVADDVKLAATIAANGVDKDVTAAIEKNIAPSTFNTILGVANPTFGIALAGCTIYDGSLTQAGPTIDDQTASQQRAYYYVQTAADQQKRGDRASGEAVGALNTKLGDISLSNPEIRASTGKMDTSSSLSSQASPIGDFSIVDVALGSTIGGVVGAVAGPTCDTLLNPYVAVGGAILGGVLTVFSGGSTAALGAAVEGGVSAATTRIVTKLVESITTKFASKEAAKATIGQFNAKARSVIGNNVQSALKVSGLTVLAKLIVLAKMNSFNNGLEQGPDFVNMADSGGNLNASVMEQRQFYGRPMTTSETVANLQADNKFIADSHKNDSAFTRYFAVSNPASLLNRMAILTANTLHASIFSSFINNSSKLLTPLTSANSLLGSTFMPRTMAAASVTPQGTFYGNVQWDYSQAEMDLLRTDFTYRVLENQSILDRSGHEDEIEEKYGSCFDGSVTIGAMLAEGMIVRDQDGNVDPNKGLCAPNHLSYENDEFGPRMIFRWRVAHNYDNGLDQLLDEQEVTATPKPISGTTTGSSKTISGDAKAIAQQILDNKNITYIFSAKQDVTLAAQGKPGTNGVPIDIRALQVVAALGKNHKIVVSAYESFGQGHSAGSDHYSGNAVDIANIDRKGAYLNITDFYSEISAYTDKAVFLQGDCAGVKSPPAGMNRKPGDACNHQHISFN